MSTFEDMDKKIRIGLIGFGRAGKAVANVLLANTDFDLVWIFKRKKQIHSDVECNCGSHIKIRSADTISIRNLILECPVDYIVDFSSSKGIYTYGETAAESGIGILSAISSYGDQEKALLKQLSEKTLVFWSPNITLGVNFLMTSAKLLQEISPNADIQIVEEHFREKKGVSGTALKIAKVLKIDKMSINSVRAGGIVGKHQVIFGLPYQTVRITHESISREAFGTGAIFAIKQLVRNNFTKGFYTFEDILLPYFNLNENSR